MFNLKNCNNDLSSLTDHFKLICWQLQRTLKAKITSQTTSVVSKTNEMAECSSSLNDPVKKELCEQFGVDLEKNPRDRFFWNLLTLNRVEVDETLLDLCRYSGDYDTKKNEFSELLRNNPRIEYDETEDKEFPKRKLYVLNVEDFGSLLGQMGIAGAKETYESFIAINRMYRSIVELELQKDAHKSKKYEECIRSNNEVLQDISKKMSPDSINKGKVRYLVLFEISENKGQWHLLRRQKGSLKGAIEELKEDYDPHEVKEIRRWPNVSHSIDVANQFKERLRKEKWLVIYNVIKKTEDTKTDYTSADLVRIIEGIMSTNRATEKADKNQELLEKLSLM